ncbi:MAG: hypothetical protein H7A44_03995 [Opitutaceae bacterium]|nr:hypothetical protein [Opitutaceae bacterium]
MNGSLFPAVAPGRTVALTLARAVAQAAGMQEQSPPRRGNKLIVLAVLGLVGMAAAWWAYRHYGTDFRMVIDAGLERIRHLGAGMFFTLMALLPAVGCPLSVFTLTAGPVFAPTLGMPVVLLLVWLSLAVNLAISYWLSRYALRPWLERLVWLSIASGCVCGSSRQISSLFSVLLQGRHSSCKAICWDWLVLRSQNILRSRGSSPRSMPAPSCCSVTP